LKRISWQKTADISASAISLLGLGQPFMADQVQAALDEDLGGKLIETVSDQCDQLYYDSGELIGDRLFAYLCTNRTSIRLQKYDTR
jgi:hypothetical protein